MKSLRYTVMLLLLTLIVFHPCVSVSQELPECTPLSDDEIKFIEESQIPVEEIFDYSLNNHYVAVIYKLQKADYIYAVYETNGRFSYAYQTPLQISGMQRLVDSEGNVIIVDTKSNPDVAYKLFNPAQHSTGGCRFYPDRSFAYNLAMLNRKDLSVSVLYSSNDKLIIQDADGKTIIVFDHSEEYKEKFGRLGSIINTHHKTFTLVGILAAWIILVVYSKLTKDKSHRLMVF